MTTFSSELSQRVEAHRQAAEVNLTEAFQLLAAGEARKAGELWWGALASAASAAALFRTGKSLDHRGVSEFLRQLAVSDPLYDEAREIGERLHANFYHNFLDPRDIVSSSPMVVGAVRKLLEMSNL